MTRHIQRKHIEKLLEYHMFSEIEGQKKDKFKGKEIKLGGDESSEIFTPVNSSNDAVEALVVLGYPRADALRAVSSVEKGLSTEDTIKAALIRLMR